MNLTKTSIKSLLALKTKRVLSLLRPKPEQRGVAMVVAGTAAVGAAAGVVLGAVGVAAGVVAGVVAAVAGAVAAAVGVAAADGVAVSGEQKA